jgi:hypothetical protein
MYILTAYIFTHRNTVPSTMHRSTNAQLLLLKLFMHFSSHPWVIRSADLILLDLTSQLLCRLCASSFTIPSSSSFIGYCMFRPNWPSSGVQVVMVKGSAAHCDMVIFPPIVVASDYFGYVGYHRFYLLLLLLVLVFKRPPWSRGNVPTS